MNNRRRYANAVRVLSMDAVEKARSGHPGMPMGMADIAQVLWTDILKYHPEQPTWFNRDRFVLSNGHGSMLLYSVLHLTGFDVSIDDLKAFRQLHSKTAGHPEYGYAPGIDTTTGPLGNGIANAVGMALAERRLSAEFNRPDFPIIDHYTYAFVGDGCLMEGLSHEAASLAGVQKLNKLIVLWDDNGISIDGPVGPWFNEDIPKRFESYGWHVIRNVDGHDAQAVLEAFQEAKKQTNAPTFICARTTIGWGAPSVAGSAHTHGAPLGAEEIARARTYLEWTEPPFQIPADIYAAWDARPRGRVAYQAWEQLLQQYAAQYPELARTLIRLMKNELPDSFAQHFETLAQRLQTEMKTMATRKASEYCIEAFTPVLPECVGGSADLSVSNLTITKLSTLMTPENPGGNYLEYGVREFGMSAIMNGMALHGGVIPFGGTFLVFSDYARSALRLAALMKIRVIFVYTHDSIGLGEDGPTHQPIEHLASLRLIPNMQVWRPCDTVETAIAWEVALSHQTGPSILALSRQNLKAQSRTPEQIKNIKRGGYVLSSTERKPDCVILATGSEVDLAMKAKQELQQSGIEMQIVSMPCFEIFKMQALAYQETVLPPGVPRVAVEAGSTHAWFEWVNPQNVLGIDQFGCSAPGDQVYTAMGMTCEALVARCKAAIQNQ